MSPPRPADRSRYGRYVDGPDPLAPPVDLAEALDAIGEDVMAGSSPERAIREFLRRGGRDTRESSCSKSKSSTTEKSDTSA